MTIAEELFPEEYEKAIKRGEAKARKQMAENMLKDGEPPEKIKKYTGVNIEKTATNMAVANPDDEWVKSYIEKNGEEPGFF